MNGKIRFVRGPIGTVVERKRGIIFVALKNRFDGELDAQNAEKLHNF
jgi:hypothetical protein